jgi:uncharacterized protein YciI
MVDAGCWFLDQANQVSRIRVQHLVSSIGSPVMKNTFVAISSAGPNRDLSKGTREQPFWDEHAAFIDRLVAEGFILMGGPLVDEGGSLLILNAKDENEVREKLKNDPWLQHGEPLTSGIICSVSDYYRLVFSRLSPFLFAAGPPRFSPASAPPVFALPSEIYRP